MTSLRGPKACQTAIAGAVTVAVAGGVAHVGGIVRCGSPWVCMVCAPVVREHRAGDIDTGLSNWLAGGGGGEFVTFTVPHDRGDSLRRTLGAVTEGYTSALTGREWYGGTRQKTVRAAAGDLLPWALMAALCPSMSAELRPNGKWRFVWWEFGIKDRLGIVGQIKALEITHGHNGWHPHIHALFVCQQPLTHRERDELRAYLYERWSEHVQSKGLRKPSWEHGLDMRPIVSAGDLANYLVKIEGGWSIGHELARTDRKKGRKAGGRSPFGIFEDFAATGDADDLELWHEYEAATFGVNALNWSPGLRGLCGLDEQEAKDEEAAAEDVDDAEVVTTLSIESRLWDGYVAAGLVGQVLDAIETWVRTREGPPPYGAALEDQRLVASG